MTTKLLADPLLELEAELPERIGETLRSPASASAVAEHGRAIAKTMPATTSASRRRNRLQGAGLSALSARALLLLVMGAASIASADAASPRIVVLATYEAGSLRITDSATLVVPRQFVGHYVEWTNQPEFLAAHRLATGATYRVTAEVKRAEEAQFSEGWGERSRKPYLTYYLRAVSAKRVGGGGARRP